MLFTLISIFFYFWVLFSIFIGKIQVAMGSISTNDTHLPIQIVTAGDSKDMTISLTKTNLESNISLFDSIEVHPIKYAS